MAVCLAVLVLAAAPSARASGRMTGPDQGAVAPQSPLPAPGQRAGPPHRALTGACPAIASGFSCLMRWRIRAAQRYLAGQPGRIGLVLHDRVTGATWRNANARADFPAASTIKLAMVTDLLRRARAGRIALTPSDWTLIYQALHESSDAAADQLWSAFENGRFLRRIARFGMTSGSFSASPPYWGYMYCSPEDLDNLMNYVLTGLPYGDRSYLIRQLRHVARIQQWGVWGAGQARRPGNKNGWEDDNGIWVTNTVGFAGPGARYTLAIMDEVSAHTGFRVGTNTLTQISALLFRGGHVPWPAAEATP
ncbi:MAG TPA: tat pathway signal sequence [Actinobacteria bacterium]|nr:tat pathway signal sequence [Actinomycetota bacterium]